MVGGGLFEYLRVFNENCSIYIGIIIIDEIARIENE